MLSNSAEASGNPDASSQQAGPLTGKLLTWWQRAAKMLDTELEIIALESERAIRSLLNLIIFGLLIGLLSLSLWFALLTQMVLLVQSITFSFTQALGLAMVANLLGIWWLLRRCRYYSQFLSFPATRKSLTILMSTYKSPPP